MTKICSLTFGVSCKFSVPYLAQNNQNQWNFLRKFRVHAWWCPTSSGGIVECLRGVSCWLECEVNVLSPDRDQRPSCKPFFHCVVPCCMFLLRFHAKYNIRHSLASYPQHYQDFNVACWKARRPGIWNHVRVEQWKGVYINACQESMSYPEGGEGVSVCC